MSTDASLLSLFRRALLAVLIIGLIGTFVELLLLKHTDGAWQLAPLALLVASTLALLWFWVSKSAAALRAHQFVMVVFLLSGVVGTVLHFIGNVKYEQESNPSLSGWELYQSALRGSTPSLAPGTMIQLALIGLLFAFRHPVLARGTNGRTLSEEQQT